MPRGVKGSGAAAVVSTKAKRTPTKRATSSKPTTPNRDTVSPSKLRAKTTTTRTTTSTTSTVLNHSIPPLYSCYLLRSMNPKRTATYIGSTPDPPRRIKQHNGLIKGGAFKTRYGRPWEQELIVYGFPSKLQALQFEWAWQHPYASRHLHARQQDNDDEHIVTASTSKSTKGKQKATNATDDTTTTTTITTRATKKPLAQFPKTPLSNRPQTKVQVLQYMLTVPPWRAFNLKLLLFSHDAKTWWDNARQWGPVIRTDTALKKWLRDRNANNTNDDPWGLKDGTFLDQVQVELRPEGVDGARLKRQGGPEQDVDKIRVDDGTHNCQATFHLPCLANHFSSTSDNVNEEDTMLPRTGSCPSCSTELHWQDLIRGSYRRREHVNGTRKTGPKRIRRLATTTSQPTMDQLVEDGESECDDVSSNQDGGQESDVEPELELEQERSWARSIEADDETIAEEQDDNLDDVDIDDVLENQGVLYYAPSSQTNTIVDVPQTLFESDDDLVVEPVSKRKTNTLEFTSSKTSIRRPASLHGRKKSLEFVTPSSDEELPKDPLKKRGRRARSNKKKSIEVIELSD
ncbi:Slx4p interacting protein [Microbotryomycetes sp. JL221]|nr:Slx4p interacting protein [Microbotryomycetes sp. JL221]